MSSSPRTSSIDLNDQSQKRTMPGSFNKFEDDKSDEVAEHEPQTTSTETPYMVKSIQANEASWGANFLAAFFSWLTLAGYVVFPGAFTSLKKSQTLASSSSGRLVQDTVKHVLVIAGVFCGIGTIGTSCLWYLWRHNAVWLVGHIFL
jgi:hypothetical protein